MRQVAAIAIAVLLTSCATMLVDRDRLVGLYAQDGLIWGSMATLELRADGSYTLGDEVVPCAPGDDEASKYEPSYASGTWRMERGLVLLSQNQSHEGSPLSRADFGNLKFEIGGSIGAIRLRQIDSEHPLLFKKSKRR